MWRRPHGHCCYRSRCLEQLDLQSHGIPKSKVAHLAARLNCSHLHTVQDTCWFFQCLCELHVRFDANGETHMNRQISLPENLGKKNSAGQTPERHCVNAAHWSAMGQEFRTKMCKKKVTERVCWAAVPLDASCGWQGLGSFNDLHPLPCKSNDSIKFNEW